MIREFNYRHSIEDALGTPVKHNPYLGMELEVECKQLQKNMQYRVNRHAWGRGEHEYIAYDIPSWIPIRREAITKTIDSHFGGKIIAKNDGSIRYGFELTSVPATIEHHRKLWFDAVRLLPQGVSGFMAKTCGIHIHLSRQFLTEQHLLLINHFMKKKQHKTFLYKIGGRPENTYCYYGHNSRFFANSYSKYHVVFPTQYQTLEFRLFKATVSYFYIMKNLEFVQSVHNFVIDINTEEKMDWVSYCRYIFKHRHKYPTLIAFMSKKGILIRSAHERALFLNRRKHGQEKEKE